MEIESKIRSYVAENLLFSDNGFPYDNDASFLQEGIVDSIGIMELVNYVESTFGITVEDHELTPDNLDSVERLANFVRSKSGS
jgi:acyl carrier protein